MNYHEINECATELVNSFASMEADTKWDQFLKMQNKLADARLDQLLATPEYVATIFAGHVRFNDASYVRSLRDSIDWPEDRLEEHLESISSRRATSIAASKLDKWRELKEQYPSHAAMVIFVTHSLAINPLTKDFLKNLTQ
jgi:hypothetical protein